MWSQEAEVNLEFLFFLVVYYGNFTMPKYYTTDRIRNVCPVGQYDKVYIVERNKEDNREILFSEIAVNCPDETPTWKKKP